MVAAFSFATCGTINKVEQKGNVSPFQFGLSDAKTGEERYEVLLKTHRAALAAGMDVDYSGIKSIEIEIPSNFTTIPLTQNNDFKGCEIIVKNTTKKVCLFSAVEKGQTISLDKALIDAGRFTSVPELRRGKWLLLIEDMNPWVKNRRGYSYGHQRKDVLLVENGKAKNVVVMPYDNDNSIPVCKYVPVGKKPLVIKNLTVSRDKASSFITNVLSVDGYDGVQLYDITINTPESDMTGDAALRFLNSTNVTLNDVNINGTYSQLNHSGYGISLNNIWNFKAIRLFGKGKWGIFGSNNVNKATIKHSEINRFDIHCYGRDVSFSDVKFFDLYNQFSSVYGAIRFSDCVFDSFIPVLIESSYNSYVPVDVFISHCVFNLAKSRNYFISAGKIDGCENERTELHGKYWPNVYINGLSVSVPDGVRDMYLFFVTGDKTGEIDGFNTVNIRDVSFQYDSERAPITFSLTNADITTKDEIDIHFENVNNNSTLVNQLMPFRMNINKRNNRSRLTVSKSRIIEK